MANGRISKSTSWQDQVRVWLISATVAESAVTKLMIVCSARPTPTWSRHDRLIRTLWENLPCSGQPITVELGKYSHASIRRLSTEDGPERNGLGYIECVINGRPEPKVKITDSTP